jgi:hypothetical protein
MRPKVHRKGPPTLTSSKRLKERTSSHAKGTIARPNKCIALPNPVYLEIRAACCRVAHLSGASEYIDKLLEDLEDAHVLSEDGPLAQLLSFVLQQEAIG